MTNKKPYCTCLTLKKVIEQVGDHSIETYFWKCANCGRTFKECVDYKGNRAIKPIVEDVSKINQEVASITWPTQDGPEVLYTIQTTEEYKIREFIDIGKVKSVIWDFEQWLRSEIKWGEDKYTEDQYKTLEDVRAKWFEIKEDVNIDTE